MYGLCFPLAAVQEVSSVLKGERKERIEEKKNSESITNINITNIITKKFTFI